MQAAMDPPGGGRAMDGVEPMELSHDCVLEAEIPMEVDEPMEISRHGGSLDNSFKMFLDVLNSKSWTGNLCMSPFGVSSVANTALYRDQILQDCVTGFKLPPWTSDHLKIRGLTADLGKSASVQTSNIFWGYNRDILPEFMWSPLCQQGVQTIVGPTSDPEQIRLLVHHFNAQVSQDTGGRISAVFTPETWPYAAYAVIVNAVHFKGVWEKQFNAKLTKLCDFYVSPNNIIQVPMMVCDDEPCLLVTESLKHFRILHLPFQADGAYMHVMIPHDIDERDVVGVLRSGCVTDNDWSSYIDLKHSVKASSYTVQMPKWKTKSAICLDKTMARLGVALGRESTTSQFCAVEVDEEGCVAKAVTRTSVAFSFRRRAKFYVDKPFIWIITRVTPDGNGRTVLVMGLLTDPTQV